MKKIIILISCCVLTLTSCMTSYEAHYDFGFDREELRFAAKDTASYFMIYGEGNWTLRMSKEVAWVNIDRFSGEGTAQINVRLLKNDGVARDVKVIAGFEDGREKQLVISQEALSSSSVSYALDYPTIELLKMEHELRVPATAGFVPESMDELEYWVEYETDGQVDWIDGLKFNYSDVTFSVKENTSAAGRTACVFWTFPAAHWETPDTLSATIVQNTQSPVIELEESYSLDSEGADSVKIVPKINWDKALYDFDLSSFTVSEGVEGKYSQSGNYIALIAAPNTSREPLEFDLQWNIMDNGTTVSTVDVKLIQNYYIPPVSLTDNGEYANCYILSDKDEAYYSIDVMLVSGVKPADDIESATVLWETAPGLVTKCRYQADENRLYIGKAKNAKGNAVVKLMNAEGDVRWSYHFWMTDMDADIPEVTVGGYTFMDRNIGALTNQAPVANESDAAGMHYQWGRKDPFPPADRLDYKGNGKMSVVYPEGVVTLLDKKTAETNNAGLSLEMAIGQPSVYFWGGSASTDSNPIPEDWSAEQNDNYWNTGDKTNYDPCPYGYVVPDELQLSSLGNAQHTDVKYGTAKMGSKIKCDDGTTENFWCASGWYRRNYNADYQLANVGVNQYYWCTGVDILSNTAGRYKGAKAIEGTTIKVWPRRWGANIRCVKETKTE